MTYELAVTCPKCANKFPVTEDDIQGLGKMIAEERADAADEAVEGHDAHFAEISELINGDRPLYQLSAALRRGGREEAELYLDRIAAILGDRTQVSVARGRYSSQACLHLP